MDCNVFTGGQGGDGEGRAPPLVAEISTPLELKYTPPSGMDSTPPSSEGASGMAGMAFAIPIFGN